MCACCGSRKRQAGETAPPSKSKRPRRGAEEEGLCLFCLEPVRRGAGAGAPAPCRHCRAPMHHECRAKWGLHTPYPAVTCPVCKKDEGFWLTAQAWECLSDRERRHLTPVAQFCLTLHAYRITVVRARWDFAGRWPWRSDTLIRRKVWIRCERLAPGVDAILDVHPSRLSVPWVPRGLLRQKLGRVPDVTMLTRLPHMDNALPPLGLSTSPPVEVLVCPLHPVYEKELQRLLDVALRHNVASYSLSAPRATRAVWWVLAVPADRAAEARRAAAAAAAASPWRRGAPPPLAGRLTPGYLRRRPCSHLPLPCTENTRLPPGGLRAHVECRAYGPVKTPNDDPEETSEILTTIFDTAMEQFEKQVMRPLTRSWGAATQLQLQLQL